MTCRPAEAREVGRREGGPNHRGAVCGVEPALQWAYRYVRQSRSLQRARVTRGKSPSQALLPERGLTEAREAEAHALMDEARDLASTPAAPPRTAEEQAATESALWAAALDGD